MLWKRFRLQIIRICLELIIVSFLATVAFQQARATRNGQVTAEGYDTGNPTELIELWVDPVHGDDENPGTVDAPLRTVFEAWERIPEGVALDTGRRINLKPGNYLADGNLPNYWESRYGTFDAPIFIQGKGTGPGQVVWQGGVNMYDVRYIYFDNLSIVPDPGGDAFHCEKCDHLLLRRMVLNGGVGDYQAQETIKVNQSQYVYIENSDISHAWDNVIDFVAVQYGHIIKNRIHHADDWCAYAKGGSAYIRVEGNEIYNCGTGGFTAGQGTGFQFMTAPWIQYEAYDVKIVNNIIHDADGAGLGVNGGYNILLAYNTMYRVGSRDHVIEVVFGQRSCDGQAGEPGRARCQEYLDEGGWGTTIEDDGTNAVNIPNQNIYIYNNVVYNPAGYRSEWQHFAIYEPRDNPADSNAPNPAVSDDNLRIHGNVIWNGSASMPLGIEDTEACADDNPTCNEAQLRADNAINTLMPQFVDAATGEFHPVGTWASGSQTFSIPDFGWDLTDVPEGANSNAVLVDFEAVSRTTLNPPGAYFHIANIITAPAYLSSGAQDGWVLESGENSNKGGSMNATAAVFNLGDDASDRQYRAILHFDTSSLPDAAVITKVTLRIKKQKHFGTNPFTTHGALRADIRKPFLGPGAALQAADFQAAPGASAVASFGTAPRAGDWYSAVLTSTGRTFVNRTGTTQFRLRFNLDDNDDNGADYAAFHSGNASVAANRPQLVIEYYVP